MGLQSIYNEHEHVLTSYSVTVIKSLIPYKDQAF